MTAAKRNILVVTPYPLLPANSGGRLYALSTVKPLADAHNFHLLAFANREERDELERNRDELYEQYYRIFRSIHFVERPLIPYELGNRWKILKHFFIHTVFGLPLMDISYYRPEAVTTAKALIKHYGIELLEVHHLHTAFCRRFISDIPAILVNHNTESELWPFWPLQSGSPLAKHVWDFFGRISRKNARGIEIGNRYRFDAKCYISPLDMAKVNEENCPLYILPMSLEEDHSPKAFHSDKFVLLWIGGFSWHPNSDGILWFMTDIWPLIKAASSKPLEVNLIGGQPPDKLKNMHDGKEIFVHGYVQDVRDYQQKADAFIVPVRAGGGVRIKIVEALNAGIPVVSTGKGCEGLPVENNRHLLVADQPGDFAVAVTSLINSIDLRKQLSREGRRYFTEHHSPQMSAQIKEEIYSEVGPSTKRFATYANENTQKGDGMTDDFSNVSLPEEISKMIQLSASDTEGMMDEWELSELMRAVIFSNPQEAEIILELGTYKGNTTSLLAAALRRLDKSNLIVSVDAFDMVTPNATNPRGSLEQWLDKNTQWKNQTVMIRGFTENVSTFIKPECVALLIIDAYHEYDAVCKDIKLYLPSVKRGGIIFVDDYNEKLFPGVYRATNKLLVNNDTIETIKKDYYAIFRKK
jgi:glycosyltransferase involved in cell wall biosynthesis/predicted O-methyltransferase YrrM